MSKTKVSSKGQVVIPAYLREQLRLKKGSEVEWSALNGESAVMRKTSETHKLSWSEWNKKVEELDKSVWKGVDPVKYVREQRER